MSRLEIKNPLLLVILDGWGHSDAKTSNAIAHAHKPTLDFLWQNFPHTFLHASGTQVGLPQGQIGSSEVGHTIIGAGRNVPQLFASITEAIRRGAFFQNPELKKATAHVRERQSRLHLIGLVSDGGVHSHWEHLTALIKMAALEGLKKDQLFLHAITDGRDVGPKTGKTYLTKLDECLRQANIGRIASVQGRYWIMDRDKRWERVEKGYNAVVLGEGIRARDPLAAVGNQYFEGKTDEFIEPTVIMEAEGPVATINNGDAVIFFNFRADRARQFVHALSLPEFNEFPRRKKPDVHLLCLTPYDTTLNLAAAFTPGPNTHGNCQTLPQYLQELKIKQLRIAETEKYAHVTYFFSGGREKPFDKEERVLVASPKVATYDETPQMSAEKITDELISRMGRFPFIVCNFANADMVGHTGNFEAARRACEFVDLCLGRILIEAEAKNYWMIVTADHGNAEQMTNAAGAPHTAHTTNVVPFILWRKGRIGLKLRQEENLGLKDIAPTIIELMDIGPAPWFEGKSLLAK